MRILNLPPGEESSVSVLRDGPASVLFSPVRIRGNYRFSDLKGKAFSRELAEALPNAHRGKSVAWGIPFHIEKALVVRDTAVETNITPTKAPWFVFMHTSDVRADKPNEHGFITPMHGIGKLGEHAADYVFVYADGSEERAEIRRRHQVGTLVPRWGENCTACVPAKKQKTIDETMAEPYGGEPYSQRWGQGQTRNAAEDRSPWNNFLWGYENPHPRKAVVALRFEPRNGTVIISGVSAGKVASFPLRWERRRKAVLTMPKRAGFDYDLDDNGLLAQIQLDLGQVISARPRLVYPSRDWASTRQNLQPVQCPNEVVIEYAAHPEASFHLANDKRIPVAKLIGPGSKRAWSFTPVKSADQRVTIRVIEGKSKRPVPVKLHVHGVAGEYLAPIDRHRIPNPAWFEDYSTDLCHGDHQCVYIPGETVMDLPLGNVYLEVTKGFEVKPVRRVVKVTRATETITIELDKVLHWREQGWVSADTHVHFLSPGTAMLEGAAEDLNLINLLASQWGELMTNVGDFDGKTTFGSKEAGGDGEYLVRVGTENRQHVLGHISLIGYKGNAITPLCSDGADEAAIGNPVDILLSEWARRCKQQGGLVIVPHFPDPRMEHAATLVLGEADGVEMCSQDDFYSGIDPYSLSDWYRYLNNGYLVPAVGGTDKMGARWAVGTVRTYAKIDPDDEFTLETWMAAVRRAETFVSYGPLMEFAVEGKPMGQRLQMSASGGTVAVSWKLASAIVPMTRVELVVNGTIRESHALDPHASQGSWSIHIDRSSWVALLVRAKYRDKPEMIAAHSTPVMVEVAGSAFYADADALTILEQIEGAMAYIDTIAIRADVKRYKEMRLVLESAYRRLHNRMHEHGFHHQHSHGTDHH